MFVARIPPAKNVIALFCDRKISFAPASGLQWICVRMHSGEKSREGGEGGLEALKLRERVDLQNALHGKLCCRGSLATPNLLFSSEILFSLSWIFEMSMRQENCSLDSSRTFFR